MKKYSSLLGVILLLIIYACSSNIEKYPGQNFIMPTVKLQPRLLYPKVAQENGYTGNTKVIIAVTKEGLVDSVFVFRSSGYELLDEAAKEYCNQLLFNPATRNGNPVSSKIAWEIKFNIADVNIDANSYLFDIQRLYRNISSTTNIQERKFLESEILKKHNEFITNMKDALGFNVVLEKVLLPEVANEWKNKWDSWPLSFLLYHDFLKRFSDYDSAAVVKKLMAKALQFDLSYIENTPNKSIYDANAKEKIIYLIKDFMSKNYPELGLGDFTAARNIKS